MVEGEVLCRDVHPAEVLLPDGKVMRELRVFVTTHRLIAYRGRNKAERVLELALIEPGSIEAARGTLPANAQIECRVDDGFAWVNRERGCGCGHGALKALTPPVGWTREAVSA